MLSHSLKLSLLLSQEPIESAEQDGTSLDEEALQLIQSTGEERERCARLLEGMFGLGGNGVNAATGGTAMNGGETAKQPGEALGASVPAQAGSARDTLPPHGDGLGATADDEDLEMEAVE